MTRSLRAVVFGAGFAGQGHARALRGCGVEIAAIAARTPAIVERVAASLDIPVASTDWRATLDHARPDIVAIATPADTHLEMALAAIARGCHVFLDKPQAANAGDARRMAEAAEAAGIKTAYAASYRYQPAALHARELIRHGAIGAVHELEFVSHYHWPRLASFCWAHRLKTGGGRLNNNFVHKLAIALQITSNQLQSIMGETRNDLGRAPVGPPIHDFRDFVKSALTPEQASACDWRDVDSDWSYTVLARLKERQTQTGDSPTAPGISASFRHSALKLGRNSDYVAIYGEGGTLHIEGSYAQGKLYLGRAPDDWRELPAPEEILRSLPDIADDTQRNWTQLAREFVADIRGDGQRDYLTLRDGWLFQEAIDAIRRSEGWTVLPARLHAAGPSDRLTTKHPKNTT